MSTREASNWILRVHVERVHVLHCASSVGVDAVQQPRSVPPGWGREWWLAGWLASALVGRRAGTPLTWTGFRPLWMAERVGEQNLKA